MLLMGYFLTFSIVLLMTIFKLWMLFGIKLMKCFRIFYPWTWINYLTLREIHRQTRSLFGALDGDITCIFEISLTSAHAPRVERWKECQLPILLRLNSLPTEWLDVHAKHLSLILVINNAFVMALLDWITWTVDGIA